MSQTKKNWKKESESLSQALKLSRAENDRLKANMDASEASINGLKRENNRLASHLSSAESACEHLQGDIDTMKQDIAHYIQAAGWWMNKWVASQTAVNLQEAMLKQVVFERDIWIDVNKRSDKSLRDVCSQWARCNRVVRFQRWGALAAILVMVLVAVVFGW